MEASVKKRGRVVLILHEDTLTGGFGNEISTHIAEQCFEFLDAPVRRCASLDTAIPINKALEDNFLTKSRLHDNINTLLQYLWHEIFYCIYENDRFQIMCQRPYFILLITLSLAACNKNKDQIKSSLNSAAGQLLKENILSFADTVNNLSKGAIKQESLIYTLGDYSFYVSRYVRNSEVSLYIELGNSGDYGNTEKRYYLKDGQVVLLVHYSKNMMVYLPFITERVFYKNGQILYSDCRESKTWRELRSLNFMQNEIASQDIVEDMKKLNDAIYQRGKFDLVFEGITEYPKAKYLIFSRDNFNTYRAPVLVEKKDNFIEALFSNPEKYKGRKLKITWALREPNEAVYVSGGLP